METKLNPTEEIRKNRKSRLAGAAIMGLALATFAGQAWACGGLFCARKKTDAGVSATAIPALAAAGKTNPVEKAAGESEKKSEEWVTLKVEGMTCASCEFTVGRALKKVKGVRETIVSAEEGSARILFDAEKAKPEDLVKAVNKTGYKASLADSSVGG